MGSVEPNGVSTAKTAPATVCLISSPESAEAPACASVASNSKIKPRVRHNMRSPSQRTSVPLCGPLMGGVWQIAHLLRARQRLATLSGRPGQTRHPAPESTGARITPAGLHGPCGERPNTDGLHSGWTRPAFAFGHGIDVWAGAHVAWHQWHPSFA